MIKKEIITSEKIIKHKFCDKCGTEIKISMACSVAKCEMCGKDLCKDCIGHEDNSVGDYRIVYCSECWQIGNSYRSKIEELENEITRLNEEWYSKCN